MSPEDSGDAVREVSAHRLSTADAAQRAVQETVSVVLEAPVTIDVQQVESYTLLCTPDDNLALATGFLLSEGIVDSLDDVASLEVCKDDPDTVRVRLKQHVPRIDDAGRNLLIVSSCGLCGAVRGAAAFHSLMPSQIATQMHMHSGRPAIARRSEIIDPNGIWPANGATDTSERQPCLIYGV